MKELLEKVRVEMQKMMRIGSRMLNIFIVITLRKLSAQRVVVICSEDWKSQLHSEVMMWEGSRIRDGFEVHKGAVIPTPSPNLTFPDQYPIPHSNQEIMTRVSNSWHLTDEQG